MNKRKTHWSILIYIRRVWSLMWFSVFRIENIMHIHNGVTSTNTAWFARNYILISITAIINWRQTVRIMSAGVAAIENIHSMNGILYMVQLVHCFNSRGGHSVQNHWTKNHNRLWWIHLSMTKNLLKFGPLRKLCSMH